MCEVSLLTYQNLFPGYLWSTSKSSLLTGVEHLHESGKSPLAVQAAQRNRRVNTHGLHGTSHDRPAVDLAKSGGYQHHVVLHTCLASDLCLTSSVVALCTFLHLAGWPLCQTGCALSFFSCRGDSMPALCCARHRRCVRGRRSRRTCSCA